MYVSATLSFMMQNSLTILCEYFVMGNGTIICILFYTLALYIIPCENNRVKISETDIASFSTTVCLLWYLWLLLWLKYITIYECLYHLMDINWPLLQNLIYTPSSCAWWCGVSSTHDWFSLSTFYSADTPHNIKQNIEGWFYITYPPL